MPGRAAAHRQRGECADFTAAVAPGSLVSLFGENLSPVNMASSEMPLPTALGDSCLTVNGALAPMLFVSRPRQRAVALPTWMATSR